MGKRLKTMWRYFQRYVRAESSEEAAEILGEVLLIHPGHFMDMACRYGCDYGRLPDNLHAAAILMGGEKIKSYFEEISKRQEA